MKRILSLLMILLVFASCAIPIIVEAGAAESGASAARQLDVNFNYDLATTLILIICTVLALLIIAAFVILAKRNTHN